MSETLIKVENVSKKFCRSLKKSLWYGMKDLGSELIGGSHGRNDDLRPDEFWAVSDISFELKRGECLGLIGRNGAGKTTLLRMLNGLIKPDKGRIEMRGRVGALIALGAGFNPILTGRENIYVNASVLGLKKKEIDAKFDGIVEFAELEEFIDAPVQSYSSGMTVRLGFAVAANLTPDILLVDEVLAVGDEGFQQRCLNKIGELKENGVGIILVSHNMHKISTYSSSVILIKDSRQNIYENISEGIRAYRNLFAGNTNEDIQKICSGNGKIKFFDIKLGNRQLSPGDSFSISARYESIQKYDDIEVDLAIYSSNEPGLHFQATNKAYKEKLFFKKGKGFIEIIVEDIRINNASGKIAIAIWSNSREELLFWWRIPLEFNGMDHSIGNNFLWVKYNSITDEN